MKINFRKHQIEGIDFLNGKLCGGLFYEMGLGKTLIMLEKHKRENIFPVLVVCPPSVVPVWEEEVMKFSYNFSTIKLIGTKHQRLERLELDRDMYIINYEGLRTIENVLYKKKFNTIILDESHRIKNLGSKQTQICLQLSHNIKNRFILTGTPVTKSPEDVWTQIQFLKPNHLGNFYAFKNIYVEYRKQRIRKRVKVGNEWTLKVIEIKVPVRFKNLSRKYMKKDSTIKPLDELIGELCLRKTKEECLDLPEKIYKQVPCGLSKEQEKKYFELKHFLKTEIKGNTLNAASATSIIQKLQQICQGFIYDKDRNPTYFKDIAKVKILKDILEDLENEKVVILTKYIADIQIILDNIKDKKILIYDGSPEQRKNMIKEFQETKEPVILLSNIEKIKEGVTLHASNNVIFYGNTYNYASRKQVEDRIHRLGQTKNCIYWDLYTQNSIEERVNTILKVKGKIADLITGDAMRLAMLEAMS